LTLLVGRQEGHTACKKQSGVTGVVVSLEQGADLHMAQLTPLPFTVSCFSKIQIGFTFLVQADPGSPGKRAVKRVCVQLQDGVFVLRLVAKNSTDLVVADIIAALWDNYKSKPMFGSRSDDDIDIDDVT